MQGADRLTLPLVAAPMTGVSGPELVAAACASGVIGAFPAHNARDIAELGEWLDALGEELSPAAAPVAVNLIMHRSNRRLQDDLACCVEHGVELVIASVGSPAAVVEPLHAAGCRVLADVATMRHVERAAETGVDGLVLLSAGAGGQTGWLNPFAFVRAARERFDGTLVLAGGVSDGTALWAAIALGADLAYMGTRFIATRESAADEAYKQALVAAGADDVELTTRATGLAANLLATSPGAAALREGPETPSGAFDQDRMLRHEALWAAGPSVAGVRDLPDVATLVARTREEFTAARAAG